MSYPAYLDTYASGELQRRARLAVASLESCQSCPRHCRVDRLHGQVAVCRSGRMARVSSYFPHLGEEDCLRGWNGSGTIFFSWCNLRCVFCQNADISQQGAGRETEPEELARMMLELQAAGCHNINFVTPEHVVPQILEALPLAIAGGLCLPLVYNTSAYDALETLTWLDGVVDIYMPDFKIWDPHQAARLLKAKNYPETARQALREMQRQVGDLVIDKSGVARRGVLVRHLVMPNDLENTRQICRWLATEISPQVFLNLMDQYRPAHLVLDPQRSHKYPDIARRLTAEEWHQAQQIAYEAGLRVTYH